MYRFQQQGWGKKNGILYSLCNWQTHKGGAGGKYRPHPTSSIIPVMEWFQRYADWIFGGTEVFFMSAKAC
jgi:hypothetical protein